MAVAAGGLLARLRRDVPVLERAETFDGSAGPDVPRSGAAL